MEYTPWLSVSGCVWVFSQYMVCGCVWRVVRLPAPPVRAVSSRCGAPTRPPPAAAATIGPATPHSQSNTDLSDKSYEPRYKEMRAPRSQSSLWEPGGFRLLQFGAMDDEWSVVCGGLPVAGSRGSRGGRRRAEGGRGRGGVAGARGGRAAARGTQTGPAAAHSICSITRTRTGTSRESGASVIGAEVVRSFTADPR